jgi:DNA-binding SARP family transcriptional activator
MEPMQVVRERSFVSDADLRGHIRSMKESIKNWDHNDIADLLLCELEAMSRMLDLTSSQPRDAELKSNKEGQVIRHSRTNSGDDIVAMPHESHEIIGVEDDGESVFEAPNFTVYCLGRFQAMKNDRAIKDWPSTKGQKLFKYFFLHRKNKIPREVLMETFWPDITPDNARNNLNVNICRLRSIVSRPEPRFRLIKYESDCYFLNPECEVWSDVELFDEHLRTSERLLKSAGINDAVVEMEQAVDLYQGELLADDPYEDWALPMRQYYREKYLKIVDTLRHHYLSNYRYSEASSLCERALGADPYDEDMLACLMACYQKLGKRHLAIQKFHAYTNGMAKDLNLFPGQELREMFTAIKSGTNIDYIPRNSFGK